MKKKFILLLLLGIFAFAKQDFYYSFIDNNQNQIPEVKKQMILTASHKLNTIRRLSREGRLDDAYKIITKFREKNKLQILKSQSLILYADILYKRGGAKSSLNAITALNSAINSSTIKREDLLEAYKLLVVLNLNINKAKEASTFSTAIIRTFDDPVSKSFGKITASQIFIHKRQYKKAIKVLYSILVKTKDLTVATVVADELYDAYVLAGKSKKAYDLAVKVLKKNIEYYANDSFLALRKVDKLINAQMPDLAIAILKMLLRNATEEESVDKFKFRLANTYMKIAGKKPFYLFVAKDLYRDLMAKSSKTQYYEQVKSAMDEILMREGRISPADLLRQYPNSKTMEQKVLLQELLNFRKEKDYKSIERLKDVYNTITDTITKRFGYKDVQTVFNLINAEMLAHYLENENCIELVNVIQNTNDATLQALIKDDVNREQLFNCLVEIPNERAYEMTKKSFMKNKDAKLYFSLERVAILLNKIDDAYEFIEKIDMVNDELVKQQEFLYRFIVYGKQNNQTSIDQFFKYTLNHPEYITANENNPMIIDFYYQYYLYLQQRGHEKIALDILNKLDKKQQEMKAFVYSPFVNMELSKNAKLDDDYENALLFLKQAFKQSRKLSDNQKANIYYDMAKIYEKLNKENRYKNNIEKCKNLKKANNFYKQMCDKL
jgi:hypothetical protein